MKALLLLMSSAWAEDSAHTAAHGAEHAGHGSIPWDVLTVQAFNVVLLLALLTFLMRKSVAVHFKTRASEYFDLVQRAEKARAEAEKGKLEIQGRLSTLEASAGRAAETARAEAETLKQKMLVEARHLAERLEQEAKQSVAVELEKAKAELRRELLSGAIENASQSLRKDLGANEQKKLQNEFAEKIQVVGG